MPMPQAGILGGSRADVGNPRRLFQEAAGYSNLRTGMKRARRPHLCASANYDFYTSVTSMHGRPSLREPEYFPTPFSIISSHRVMQNATHVQLSDTWGRPWSRSLRIASSIDHPSYRKRRLVVKHLVVWSYEQGLPRPFFSRRQRYRCHLSSPAFRVRVHEKGSEPD